MTDNNVASPEAQVWRQSTISELILEKQVEDAAALVQAMAQYSIQLAGIDRVPRYISEKRENDAEHSYMLALLAPEVAAAYFPELNPGLVAQFAVVHELTELLTGDIPTFDIDETEVAQKAVSDQAATTKLIQELPKHTGVLLRRYEHQVEPEARFVRLVDKITPVIVDILGPGKQVMEEDYGVHSRQQMDAAEQKSKQRYRAMFPEPELDLIHGIREALSETFIRIAADSWS